MGAVLAIPAISTVLPHWTPPEKAPPSALFLLEATPEITPAGVNAVQLAHSRSIPWPIAIWLAGAITALTRVGGGHVRLARLLRRAQEVRAPEWIAARDTAAALLGLRRTIKLVRSAETDVPLAAGVFATSVVLPENSQDWDAERRHLVLLHELTHARRIDPLVRLIARVAGALYWFHPLMWLAVARLRREQERSCDDAVLRAGTAQSTYAEHLVSLARGVSGAHGAALAMAATSEFEQRVRALLDARRNRSGMSARICWTAAAAALAVVLPLAALHGQESTRPVSLAGTVYDASGAVVPGVLVLLKSNTNHEEASRANAAGEFTFSGLPAGSYTLEVRAPGFAQFQNAVVVPAGHTNITLAIGQVNEAVEVVGKSPGPAPAAGTPRCIRVGGMVQATKLVSMIKPVYPPGAEAAGIEGTVLLRAVISTTGDLLGLSVINQSVDGDLAGAAMDAVKQWHYQPTLLNGEPVEVVTTIAVTFRLEQ